MKDYLFRYLILNKKYEFIKNAVFMVSQNSNYFKMFSLQIEQLAGDYNAGIGEELTKE